MTTVLLILEIVGIVSFSISGALVAIDKEHDLVGVLFLAIITTFGGGMLRDVFIGNTPPVFFTSYHLIIICAATALLVFVLASVFKKHYLKEEQTVQAINNYFDALGLGVFVVYGAKICIDAGITNPFLIIAMGMVSGTAGSMVRDIMVREIPALLKKRIYLVAAIAGASLYYLLFSLGVTDLIAIPASAVLITVIRILATVFKWNMPKAIRFSEIADSERLETNNKKIRENGERGT